MRHTLYWEREEGAGTLPDTGELIELVGDEAMHAAKSKRLREGDGCLLCDGAGVVASCVVVEARKSRVVVRVEGAAVRPAPTPRVEVCGATPKGQRLDKMLDMLAQCGASCWRPLVTSRGVVEPGAHKLERARRISVEALKQSGRAHLMAIGEEIAFEEALEGARVVVCDGSGASGEWRVASGADHVRVLIGSEGGFTPEEMTLARERGAEVVRLGAYVLRIETAAVVATGLLMSGSVGG